LDYGMPVADPTQRVAPPGTLKAALNNTHLNTAKTLGWYSPLNALKRSGYDFNIPVRLLFTYAGTTYYKFLGSLANILPTAGRFTTQTPRVRFSAVGGMADASRLGWPGRPIVTDQ